MINMSFFFFFKEIITLNPLDRDLAHFNIAYSWFEN